MIADLAGTPSRPSLIGLVVIASLNAFPPLRPTLWRWWYDTLARRDSETELVFMNYGFAQAQDEGARLALDSADEPFRYPIQLYHHVLEPLAVAGKDVLEVGCGRGGGASFLARYHRPGTVLGVDLSSEAIARCRELHVLPGVEFREGRAEALPCSDSSVDVVINVESSHCYASMSKFLREVARVLRPGGHFAICDLRAATGWEQLRPAFEAAGLEILAEESINGPVVRALDLVFEKRRQRIDERVPRFWRRVFRDFAGLKETVMYNMLRDGRLRYMNLLARRPL
jgi:ubiquinone/menaquinone biosynthesis C-methylase UbiE